MQVIGDTGNQIHSPQSIQQDTLSTEYSTQSQWGLLYKVKRNYSVLIVFHGYNIRPADIAHDVHMLSHA